MVLTAFPSRVARPQRRSGLCQTLPHTSPPTSCPSSIQLTGGKHHRKAFSRGAWERQGPGSWKKSLCLPGEPTPPPPVLHNCLTSPRPHRCEERPRWLLERHPPRSSARPCLWKQSPHRYSLKEVAGSRPGSGRYASGHPRTPLTEPIPFRPGEQMGN